jgi:hypothetical protein
MNYFASVLYAIAVILGGVKIAVDHWPCEFMAKGACSAEFTAASSGDGPRRGFANSHHGIHSGQVR